METSTVELFDILLLLQKDSSTIHIEDSEGVFCFGTAQRLLVRFDHEPWIFSKVISMKRTTFGLNIRIDITDPPTIPL